MQQTVAIGSGTRTTAPGLDPEKIVEQADDEAVVKVAVAVADQE